RVVFPVDAPPIENGVVTIEEDRIVHVGAEARGGKGGDLGTAALTPGFVKAHTHLEVSYLREPPGQPGMSLVEWMRLVIAERGRAQQPGSLVAMGALIENGHVGVTTVADITTGAEIPISHVVSFHEVIGFSRARAESAMKALLERLDPSTPY